MKKSLIVICFVLSVFCFTGCSMEDFGFEFSTGTGLKLTKAKYDRISYGDSYSKVKSILGGECSNYYSHDKENWYTCVDDKDSSKRIVLKFVNNKLTSKSSSGLN